MENNNKSVEVKSTENVNPVLKVFNSVLDFFKTKVFRRASLLERRARAGYVFVLPFLLGIILIYLPILIDSVWFSFNDLKTQTGGGLLLEFRGLDHYISAFENQSFTTALLAAIQQLIFEVPAIIVFSLFIAVVLNQKMLGRAAFRAIFFVPVIISTGLMASINAADMMSGSAGQGIDDGSGQQSSASDIISVLDVQQLFSSMKVGGELVTYVVQLVNNVYSIINYSGIQMLIFLAGLQSISPAIYEACQIEGATGWETFWKITFPMISPMILVNAIYTIIDSFTRTNNPVISFVSNLTDYGKQSAMSWMYFIIVGLILVVFAAIASSFVFYQRRD